MNLRKIELMMASRTSAFVYEFIQFCSAGKRRLIKKFLPVKLLEESIARQSYFAHVQSSIMFLDPNDGLHLAKNHIYEELETKFIKQTVKKNSIVIDVGANIGYYTLIFAKIVGKNGRVYAFEPAPSNFCLLKKNVEFNGFTNVELVQKAASNKTGQIKLFVTDDAGDNRIYDSDDNRKSVRIDATTLDDFFQNDQALSFVKIDTQGADAAVVQGMARLMHYNKNVRILTEFWPFGLASFGIEPKQYLTMLTDNGFKLYNVDFELGVIRLTVIDDLLRRYTVEKKNYTNLICTRDALPSDLLESLK
jgi:FkbM family methyltransferase